MCEVRQDTLGNYARGDGLCLKGCCIGCKIEFCPTESPTVFPFMITLRSPAFEQLRGEKKYL